MIVSEWLHFGFFVYRNIYMHWNVILSNINHVFYRNRGFISLEVGIMCLTPLSTIVQYIVAVLTH